MSVEQESYFRCKSCGTVKRSTSVEYTVLGFPICPACNTAETFSGFTFGDGFTPPP
ncbi:hypothetical protein HUB97_07995 [Halorubraceae archaeon YAN]|nr:hypothetical protein [Halorubraceae archaeon YAN]